MSYHWNLETQSAKAPVDCKYVLFFVVPALKKLTEMKAWQDRNFRLHCRRLGPRDADNAFFDF